MSIKTPANNQKELTDADVVEGGPLDPNSQESQEMTNNQSTQDQENASTKDTKETVNNQAPQQPIIVNGRSFKDANELALYTSQLESSRVQQQAPAQKQVELIDGKPISEVMFDDPQRYHEYVLEKAKNLARDEFHTVSKAKDNEKQFWNDFYTKNPDLKDVEEVVKDRFTREFADLAKLPVEQAQIRLASSSRSFVDKILQKKGVKTTELPSGGASTLGATGAVAPRVNKPEPKLSFLDQVKAARKKA